MKNTTNLVCICCPIGCNLEIKKSGADFVVTGNKCKRGENYAIEEITAPKRIVTSTVKVRNGAAAVVSVKTDKPVLKEKIFTIMQTLANVELEAPVQIGTIVIANIAGSGANIITTKSIYV